MNDTKNPELMECPFCGSNDVYTEHDIGSDIWADEKDVIEQAQHRDVCQNCCAWRFRFEAISAKDGPLPVTVGKWKEYDPELARWMTW